MNESHPFFLHVCHHSHLGRHIGPAGDGPRYHHHRFFGPLSGGGAQFGQNLKWGLEMAVDDINDMGGITVNGKAFKLRVVAMDDQFQTAMTVNNAKRLRHKENARFILNPSTGGIFGLMSINEREGFIIGAYTTTHEVVTQGNKMIFRIPAPMMAYVTAGANEALARGWKRCAMMQGAYDYGKIWSSLFQKYWNPRAVKSFPIHLWISCASPTSIR